MRILMHPNDLVLGGASLNAVELAATLRDRGHDVLVASPWGDLGQLLEVHGLRHVPTPYANGRRPQLAPVLAAASAARSFSPDVIHTWEFGPYLSVFYGVRAPRTAHLATVMSMEFPSYLPRTVPVTMGTRALVEQVRSGGHRAPVHLLEPPIDVATQHAGPAAVDALRDRLRLSSDTLKVVIVSRLAASMKAEGILDSIRAVADLAATAPVELVVVGDGDARQLVESAARHANEASARRAITVAGAMQDPRPAYALADVVIGMGSSALRGMAFGRPVVVVGVDGFVELVSPETFSHFDLEGMWGVGGCVDRRRRLVEVLQGLVADPEERERLGRWGRATVLQRYSLQAAATQLEQAYHHTVGLRHSAAADIRESVLTLARTGPRALRAPYTRTRALLKGNDR